LFEAAGIAGVDPWPYTFRQLVWMSNAKQRSEWEQTALIAALIHNTNSKTKRRVDDFNPFKETSGPRMSNLSIGDTAKILAAKGYKVKRMTKKRAFELYGDNRK